MYGIPASVSSLDKDMRTLRLDRYTPQAAKELREWIETAIGERLAPGDLMEALKDGVALCKLANMALPPPGIRYKPSVMPFVQMENISLFLRACQAPPLNLQPHDVFLTVDLYEQKDPAQVVQCIGAFSRVANKIAPSKFPTAIGPSMRSGGVSPERTAGKVGGGSYGNRGVSGSSNASSAYSASATTIGGLTPSRTGNSNSGRLSPTKDGRISPVKNGGTPLSPGTPGSVSSWSRKQDEDSTSPAWSIHQYGYMGGADQGKMGVAFGARRQITTAAPHVPSMAEKEKRRREEEERLRIQAEEAEHKRRVEREAEEERARIEEEQRWEEETRKLREKEAAKAAEEKRKWEDDERRWKMEEEARQREEKEAEERAQRAKRARSAERRANQESEGQRRIQELERELEMAREREQQYERERQERLRARDGGRSKSRNRSRSRPREPPRKEDDEEWLQDERGSLRREWKKSQGTPPVQPPRPLPTHENAPPKPPRPQTEGAPLTPPRPQPEYTEPVRLKPNNTGPSARPLPDPAKYAAASPATTYSTPAPTLPSRTDRYLSDNPAPKQETPKTTYSSEIGGFDSTAERDAEDRRRAASQTKTKAGGWASKSLLEREMEMERQRQKEWEEAQMAKSTGTGTSTVQSTVTGGSGATGRRIGGPRPPPGR
jgi:hypothetical protein